MTRKQVVIYLGLVGYSAPDIMSSTHYTPVVNLTIDKRSHLCVTGDRTVDEGCKTGKAVGRVLTAEGVSDYTIENGSMLSSFAPKEVYEVDPLSKELEDALVNGVGLTRGNKSSILASEMGRHAIKYEHKPWI